MDAESGGQIFTVGHGGRTPAALVEQLKQSGVRYVVDVRSIPYSRHQPDFCKEPLQRFLTENGLGGWCRTPLFLFDRQDAKDAKESTCLMARGVTSICCVMQRNAGQ